MSEEFRAQALADQLSAAEAAVEPSARGRVTSALTMLSSFLIGGFLLDWQLTHPLMLFMYAMGAVVVGTVPVSRHLRQRRVERLLEQHERIVALTEGRADGETPLLASHSEDSERSPDGN